MRSTTYTLGFATAICVACSLIVSSAATLLRDRQQKNIEIDIQKNILRSVGFLAEPGAKVTADEVQALYSERIKSVVIDTSGQVVAGKTPKDIGKAYLDPKAEASEFPLYIRMDEGSPTAYAFPVTGKGLWSTLYGYMALDPDAITVRGLTFYQHAETPGLGAEIEKSWFLNNFKGKKVLDAKGEFTSITVLKGKVKDYSPEMAPHSVDGISGASLTTKGVTRLLRAGLLRYDPLLSRIRKGEDILR